MRHVLGFPIENVVGSRRIGARQLVLSLMAADHAAVPVARITLRVRTPSRGSADEGGRRGRECDAAGEDGDDEADGTDGKGGPASDRQATASHGEVDMDLEVDAPAPELAPEDRYARRLRRAKRRARSGACARACTRTLPVHVADLGLGVGPADLDGEAAWVRDGYAASYGALWAADDRVPRIDYDKVSEDEFIERFERPAVPVVVVGACATWPAVTRWTVEVRPRNAAGCVIWQRRARCTAPSPGPGPVAPDPGPCLRRLPTLALRSLALPSRRICWPTTATAGSSAARTTAATACGSSCATFCATPRTRRTTARSTSLTAASPTATGPRPSWTTTRRPSTSATTSSTSPASAGVRRIGACTLAP